MTNNIIKFIYALRESFARIFTGLINTFKTGEEKKTYTYYGKIKDEETGKTLGYGFKTYTPDWFDTILAYFGTVIPWNYIEYEKGQKYGKGDFGKLIVGLVIVSAVIIVIGGTGITMLFLCFAFYCMKTLSMFSDNLKEKGKSKA